jgi:voltage-gated potassium channel
MTIMNIKSKKKANRFQALCHEVIFEADTAPGKLFDVLLIFSITLSVLVVMLDSINSVKIGYGNILWIFEWGFTLVFTIEYLLRLYCVGSPFKYAMSFYGMIDLLSILPTYISLLVPGSHYLIVIRILRVLRVFRVLKLTQYLGEANMLWTAIRASRRKIFIFLFTVLTLVVIIGSIMYVIEGQENGFTSIPRGIYWAIVTLTTVGYGDISPHTVMGQALASVVMIMGYGIIAVPTGIVTVEMSAVSQKNVSTQVCTACSAEGHDSDAKFCKYCGTEIV